MGRKTQVKCKGDEARFEEVARFVYERFGNSVHYIADVAGGPGGCSPASSTRSTTTWPR